MRLYIVVVILVEICLNMLHVQGYPVEFGALKSPEYLEGASIVKKDLLGLIESGKTLAQVAKSTYRLYKYGGGVWRMFTGSLVNDKSKTNKVSEELDSQEDAPKVATITVATRVVFNTAIRSPIPTSLLSSNEDGLLPTISSVQSDILSTTFQSDLLSATLGNDLLSTTFQSDVLSYKSLPASMPSSTVSLMID